MTAATSAQNRKDFAVLYNFLPLCFRDNLRSKFPRFMTYVMGEATVDEAALVSPTFMAAQGNMPAVQNLCLYLHPPSPNKNTRVCEL